LNAGGTLAKHVVLRVTKQFPRHFIYFFRLRLIIRSMETEKWHAKHKRYMVKKNKLNLGS
jgi:hypothetical protein